MQNIKLTIQYEGTEYLGWQKQTSSLRSQVTGDRPKTKNLRREKVRQPSIQGTIELAIYKIVGERVKLVGSGRTDAGVHAIGQIANFKTDSRINSPELYDSLNSILPKDIFIQKVEEVEKGFNAQYDAKYKKYSYNIINTKFLPPFYRRFYTHVSYPLRFDVMQKEAQVLKGEHDFKSFQVSDKRDGDTVKEIKDINLEKRRNIISIDIGADGFLYKMVRSIVGTLIEIGRGKFPSECMKKILKSEDRRTAGPTAEPTGLFLVNVEY